VIFGLRPALVIFALSLGSLVPAAAAALAVDAASLEAQLSARGIRDTRVLEAFAAVPRDVFVPERASERAYDDKPLPAGFTQTISQPYLLARMAELLQIKPEARVLEVGTGTGYAAAIVAQMAREVFSVGVIPELAATARLRFAREGYQNVHVKLGDGALGWREYGPYDAIVVTSIGARVPPALVEQLVEGGVLVMPVGPPRGRQVLLRGVKKGFKLHAKEAGELREASADGDDARKRKPGRSGDRRNEPNDAVREQRPRRDSDDPQSDR
jgi:protein-L-isoaspartate(D-aspartate) O-methyltransferase